MSGAFRWHDELLVGHRDDVGGIVPVQGDGHGHSRPCVRVDGDRIDRDVDVRSVVRRDDVDFGERALFDRKDEVVLRGCPARYAAP